MKEALIILMLLSGTIAMLAAAVGLIYNLYESRKTAKRFEKFQDMIEDSVREDRERLAEIRDSIDSDEPEELKEPEEKA